MLNKADNNISSTLLVYPEPELTIKQTVLVPGDKSISHRSMILGGIADGTTHVSGFLEAADCLATMQAMQSMGVKIEKQGEKYAIHGVGKHGLKPPIDGKIDCGNSGTGMRLLAGVMAAQQFDSQVFGDESLNSRPMQRITKPLTTMGANVSTTDAGTAPMKFKAVDSLNSINYQSPVASAQVKSCVLLAGLYAKGEVKLTEPKLSRDHTENMLRGFGCELESNDLTVTMQGGQSLKAIDIIVPADISSSAFFMVLATLLPNSQIIFRNLCVNPSRTGVISILQLMGADITFENQTINAGEHIADVVVKSSELQGIDIPHEYIASAIDEFPIIFIAAALAKGETRLTNAMELRKKESDRITAMHDGMKILGVDCHELDDGIIIKGGSLMGGKVDAKGDHRIAMSFLIAGQFATQPIEVKNCENIITSFPNFLAICGSLGLQIINKNSAQNIPVITVDGPSGVGKGTTASLLSNHLGWHLLDSGAIYRSLALKVLNTDTDTSDIDTLISLAENLALSFKTVIGEPTLVYLDGDSVNTDLRAESCGTIASIIASIPEVRATLLQRQIQFRQAPGLVADGRDMGTVVFKDAQIKFFLTASPQERAKRRYKQLKNKGVDANIRALEKEIGARDARDSNRKVSPLVPADDAIIIDTSELSINEVFQFCIEVIDKAGIEANLER